MTKQSEIHRYRMTLSDKTDLRLMTAFGPDTAKQRAEEARHPLKVVAIEDEGPPPWRKNG